LNVKNIVLTIAFLFALSASFFAGLWITGSGNQAIIDDLESTIVGIETINREFAERIDDSQREIEELSRNNRELRESLDRSADLASGAGAEIDNAILTAKELEARLDSLFDRIRGRGNSN